MIPISVALALFVSFLSTRESKNLGTFSCRERDDKWLEPLCRNVGIDIERATLEEINGQAAFCNKVYRIISQNGTSIIAKRFSELALARMDPQFPPGDIDLIVAGASLGPKILATSKTGILMEDLKGKVLTEENIHGSHTNLLPVLGRSLAQLHQIKLPREHARSNILWRNCNVMLSKVEPTLVINGWNKNRLEVAFSRQKNMIEGMNLPMVDLTHGDCKPSNIILFNSSKDVRLIDFEIGGSGYAEYDLAKLWRTKSPTDSTSNNMRLFLESYIESIRMDKSVNDLKGRCNSFLAMTWLEAVLFFFCMLSVDSANAELWHSLAADRLKMYEELEEFTTRVFE